MSSTFKKAQVGFVRQTYFFGEPIARARWERPSASRTFLVESNKTLQFRAHQWLSYVKQ